MAIRILQKLFAWVSRMKALSMAKTSGWNIAGQQAVTSSCRQAVELVNRLLLTGGSIWSTISAKAATATIPIVFSTASDPVKLGFVASLNRPGGNVTGVSFLGAQLVEKRLELATQLVPKEVAIGFIGRPREPRYAADRKVIESAAAALGGKILFLDIADERELGSAFATAKREHVGVLIPLNDPFFINNRSAFIALAARYSLPTIYESREPVGDGGLMSYGTSIRGAYRLGRLCRPHSQGREAGRPAGDAIEPLRNGY
jgi:ABC-type uncharacterized transport system substrate-binding protein